MGVASNIASVAVLCQDFCLNYDLHHQHCFMVPALTSYRKEHSEKHGSLSLTIQVQGGV